MLRTIPIDIANPLTNWAPTIDFEAPVSLATLSLGEFESTTPSGGVFEEAL
jgi:hypothetical protein